ncbi:Family S45 unassigned peptidase [Pseudoalteromonas luteoviolacea B = ATCC 29581]|nr:Family S45 unassigned peptidase [Pseudoalteromonas luteoviolacea B = ATCC 29581]
MITWFKRLVYVVLVLGLLATAVSYGVLTLSLPKLDGQGHSATLLKEVEIGRDVLGQAVIQADNRQDAAYGLGYAHGQDRYFQMDLLRRNAAGELSELFGRAALDLDKRMRFHQLRKRAQAIVLKLPREHQATLEAYAQGVNEGRKQVGFPSFEYLLTQAPIAPWQPEDSILVIFSMYLDLQAGTFERDKALIVLEQQFGVEMREFLTQPSRYQAALDGSQLPLQNTAVPTLPKSSKVAHIHIESPLDIGSNNWAVTGALTATGAAMLSDDMHLGLNVPPIWYRAQLNYFHQGKPIQVTGVSLPGAPAIVVGTNNEIAWGFTNGYLDTADWVKVDESIPTQIIKESLALPKGQTELFPLELSEYGPVTQIAGQRYALSWVAHQPYAVNLALLQLETLTTAQEALALAPTVGIPVQNLMVVDANGNAGWRNMGAVPSRSNPSDVAISSEHFSSTWHVNELDRPFVYNPETGRLWTGNSRVVSVGDHARFGDGGYALGARAVQIRDRLFEQSQFDEAAFNQLQLDNEARFLEPWHALLVATLERSKDGVDVYQEPLLHLQNWQKCACPHSVGYTLVEAFRNEVINMVFATIEQEMMGQGVSLKPIKRYLEPAIWKIIEEQPQSWLHGHENIDKLLISSFTRVTSNLTERFGSIMASWTWGEVNALTVQHPFSKQMPILAKLLDMPTMPATGDTFMPAVQMPHFGASQRFIVQPGHLDKAIMTVAGGQSGHPLSEYYRAGFDAYAKGEQTPLLPGELRHKIIIKPQNEAH